MAKTGNSKKILVVDDIPENITVLNEILKSEYSVIAATSGSKALAISQSRNPPDLILLDIVMPDMDGYEVCTRLKSDKKTLGIPVIFVTTKNEIMDEYRGFEVGAVDYVTKPVSPPIVKARVRTHLSLSTAQRDLRELLSKTLMGSVRIMTDILSFASPEIFDQATRLKRYARRIAEFLELPEIWRFEMAAALSHIGCVALPPNVRDRMHSPEKMKKEDRKIFETHPSIGKDLLEKIPRLENIARMIEGQLKPFGQKKLLGEPKQWDEILMGSQILKVITDFDTLVLEGQPPLKAMDRMRQKTGEYIPQLLAAMLSVVEMDGAIAERTLHLEDLRPGMVLLEDIISQSGVKLIKRGSELSDNLINLLLRHVERTGITQPVRVLDPAAK